MDSIVLDFTPLDRWGQWRFDGPRLCLVHEQLHYEVDLEKINSCAKMLDWIFQIKHKVEDYEFENFVQALDDIFGPQARCCSFGVEKPFEGFWLSRTYAKKLLAHGIKLWTFYPEATDVYYFGEPNEN